MPNAPTSAAASSDKPNVLAMFFFMGVSGWVENSGVPRRLAHASSGKSAQGIEVILCAVLAHGAHVQAEKSRTQPERFVLVIDAACQPQPTQLFRAAELFPGARPEALPCGATQPPR